MKSPKPGNKEQRKVEKSNQKSGMVPELVTLIQYSKMDIVTKFQVSIFKNDKVRGGDPPPPNVK